MAGPIKHGLIAKSREAALTAVQTYNNPLVRFKSESFIVLMTIAWTYLMHAYYARERVDYRYLDKDKSTKRKYARTRDGGFRYWELASCINVIECPLDHGTVNNLMFLIGLRNLIEHHRPPHLDEHLSSRYLACALNYDHWLTEFFGAKHSLGETVAMALQFRDLHPAETALGAPKLPARVSNYIERFDGDMTDEEFNDPRFAVRLMFTRKVVNKKGQADRAIEFVKAGDPGAEDIEPERWVVKDTEKPKFRAKAVVAAVQAAGYGFFGMYQHTKLWQGLGAKDPGKGSGVVVANEWFWYDLWIEECKRQCQALVESKITPVGPRGGEAGVTRGR